MKRLSLMLLGAMLLLSLSAFCPSPAPSVPQKALPQGSFVRDAVPPALLQTYLYWFLYPDDYYNDYNTIQNEIEEETLYFGATVNTNSSGGALIDEGYYSSQDPHTGLPSVLLYLHY